MASGQLAAEVRISGSNLKSNLKNPVNNEHIRDLDISACNIDDASLTAVSQISSLITLNIQENKSYKLADSFIYTPNSDWGLGFARLFFLFVQCYVVDSVQLVLDCRY